MSPTLFVLAMEYFSRLMKHKASSLLFNFHPKCKEVGITHLAFADDVMLFSRGDLTSVKAMLDVLGEMESVSGLCVNNAKSNLFMAGVKDDERRAILELTDIPLGSFPVRYLGIPLSPMKVSCEEFAPLLTKVEGYLHAWNSKTLSYAGRLELVKSVIQGVESFWLQAFPIQASILDRIVSLCRSFLWSGKGAKVAWCDLCVPKEEGGLGLKDCKVWNNALLSKVLWNIHLKADSLWVRWVNTVYLRHGDVWTWVPQPSDSPLFKKLALIRDRLLQLYGTKLEVVTQLETWAENGKLASGKVYDALRVKHPRRPWMAMIWKRYIPPKFSFIAWLAFRNRLSTKDGLTFMEVDPRCALCNGEDETVEHLFFGCPYSKGVWEAIRRWLGETKHMTSLRRAVRVIRSSYDGATMKCKAMKLALPCVIYHLWRARNSCTMEGIRPSTVDLIVKIKLTIFKVLGRIYPTELVRAFMC